MCAPLPRAREAVLATEDPCPFVPVRVPVPASVPLPASVPVPLSGGPPYSCFSPDCC